jgi:predicted nucleic acid-binding protein
MDLLVRGGYLTLQPVSRTVLLETVKLRATRATGKLKLPDAIHLTTAVLSGCRMFVSRDRGIPMPEGMQRVEADVSSVARMIEALH